MITDEFEFNKHVRGEFKLTYWNVIKNHSWHSNIKYRINKIADVKSEAEKIIKNKKERAEISNEQLKLDRLMTDDEKWEYNQEILKGAEQYCYCWGLGS